VASPPISLCGTPEADAPLLLELGLLEDDELDGELDCEEEEEEGALEL